MDEIAPAREAPEYSPDQLHGEACIVCGSGLDGLTPVGHVYTAGIAPQTRHGWAVRACPQHVTAGERLCAHSLLGGVA